MFDCLIISDWFPERRSQKKRKNDKHKIKSPKIKSPKINRILSKSSMRSIWFILARSGVVTPTFSRSRPTPMPAAPLVRCTCGAGATDGGAVVGVFGNGTGAARDGTAPNKPHRVRPVYPFIRLAAAYWFIRKDAALPSPAASPPTPPPRLHVASEAPHPPLPGAHGGGGPLFDTAGRESR